MQNGGSGPQIPLHDVEKIGLKLFVPFLAGQLSRPLTARWMERQRKLLGSVARGSILLVVYSAFSEGTLRGIWQQNAPYHILVILLPTAAPPHATPGLPHLAPHPPASHTTPHPPTLLPRT